MLLITGATGTLGGAIVDQLLARAVDEEIAVAVRDPAKAQPLADREVIVRQGDYTRPDTLRSAFEGARQVLIVSSNSRAGDALQQHRNAIEAAAGSGAERILYTSHAGARADSAFEPARRHFETERLLAESGVRWTALRNGFYAVTPTFYIGGAAETGVLALPADGPVAWTAQADLAEAAALVLLAAEPIEGPTRPLTGSEALSFDDVAEILTELRGTEVTREVLPDEAWVEAAVARGMPEGAARFSLGVFAAARRGDFATLDPTLERLLGRPPIRLREVLAEASPQPTRS